MPSSSTYLALLLLAITIAAVAGKEFVVGDDVGWRVPASNETELYNVWASRRRFHIGDSLRFQYKNDSVVETVKFAFYHCDSRQPISTFDDGNTVINLDKVGKFYFISGKADRCNKGEKMIVNVMLPHHHSSSSIATPPNSPDSTMAPAPAPGQLSGSGSSDSGPAVSISVLLLSMIVAIAGLWLCIGQP